MNFYNLGEHKTRRHGWHKVGCHILLLNKFARKKKFKAKLFTIWGGKCGVIISLENSIYNESIRDYFLLGFAFVFSYLLGNALLIVIIDICIVMNPL